MDDADAMQPLNPRPRYAPGDHDAFYVHVGSGGKVEADDWMPDEYRAAVLKFVEMHANSELMGVLPERDWILRAPTLRRKLALTSKIQDEVGHAQLLYRVAEDLGKPRSAMLQDLLDGKTKFHNVFHYPTRSWADVGIIAWLVDAAAIVSQQALRDSSYAPYARTMKKICWEESVHIMHGRDVVLTLMNGTTAQRAMVQEALDRWWGPLMQMHGPPTDPAKDKDLHWKIKAKNNEQLRQEFLSIYVPRILELGLRIPDPALARDPESGRWSYTEPDWSELKAVVTGHGPASQERLGFRRASFAETQWVRDALLGASGTAAA
jgi:ring-1,2-phenylacetyl-CoA epoxidase subunit PaaA